MQYYKCNLIFVFSFITFVINTTYLVVLFKVGFTEGFGFI